MYATPSSLGKSERTASVTYSGKGLRFFFPRCEKHTQGRGQRLWFQGLSVQVKDEHVEVTPEHLPHNIHSDPSVSFKEKGWKGWRDFLGNSNNEQIELDLK